MRRAYGVAGYLDACARARAALPGLNLTTDAIVGFPGEDAAAFARTAAVVREAGITKVHVFPYSPAPAPRPRRWPARCPPRRRASGRPGCATCPSAPAWPTAPGGWGPATWCWSRRPRPTGR